LSGKVQQQQQQQQQQNKLLFPVFFHKGHSAFGDGSVGFIPFCYHVTRTGE